MHATEMGIVNLIIGLLVIGISIPLVLRKIPMNHWYGVRLPKAFQSDENWYAINAYGGKWMIGCGVILVVSGALALGIGIQHRELLRAFEYAPCLILLILVPILIYSWRL